MLRSADDRPVQSIKMTPVRKGRSAVALFSPGHNDDETEKQVARQTRQLEQKNRHLNLMSPVLSSPKASKAKIPAAAAADLHTSRLSLSHASLMPLNASSSSLPSVPGATKLTREQMAKTFDEWMKIAADNKINAKNSWNFALIDYFSELSLLRDGEGINFQKASCTLDGCVKIYTSRIDSAVDETGQLLVGLATEGLEGEEAGSGQKASSSTLSRKKLGGAHGSAESTLAKTVESLNVRSYDLEFSVDPLFKKTCADFDESGSSGKLLLNHLTLSSSGNILLDASQSRFDPVTEPAASDASHAESVTVDMQWLGEGLDAKEMIPSLSSLAQSAASFDLNTVLDNLSRLSLTQPVPFSSSSSSSESDPFQASPFKSLGSLAQKDVASFSIPAPFEEGDSFGSGGEDEPEVADHDIRLANLNSSLLPSASMGMGGMVSTGSEEMEAETEREGLLSLRLVHSNLLSHVNATQHWAGPEHWKISRAYPNLHKSTLQTLSASNAKRLTKTRSAAVFEPFDFSAAAQVDIKALFAPPSSQASITLPVDSIILNSPKARHRNLLPIDLGLSSQTLLGLFSKPGQLLEGKFEKMMAKAQSMQTDVGGDGAETACFEDGDFESPALFSSLGPSGGDGEDEDGDGDGDGDAGDEKPWSDLASRQLLLSGSSWADSQSGSAAPLHVARVAKRVDVHLLKENLLSVLRTSMEPASRAQGDQLFSSALRKLQPCYSEADWQQVSPAYCFVSLLHLANEQNLSLKSLHSGSDLMIQSD